jgi:hypothetical protein
MARAEFEYKLPNENIPLDHPLMRRLERNHSAPAFHLLAKTGIQASASVEIGIQ